jgi:L-threonylcarbamoyladenylate synthase
MPLFTPEGLPEVAAAIERGEVVGIPTDTVYGLAALPTSKSALRALAKMKGRSRQQPIALLIDSVDAIAEYVEDPGALGKARPFWPGALTVVVRVRPGFPVAAVTKEGTVGVRLPDDLIARSVIASCGGVLAVTSANRHGEPPALSAQEVLAIFGDELVVLDGGPRPSGMASTVIDLASDPPRIIREGPVPFTDLKTEIPGLKPQAS